jgi:SAM-dependent methyltransferase
MMGEPQTWHHGLIADWWAEFNTDGPEIDYFARFVERGQPALDAGCGAGRLLVPWLQAGYDVDGSDASADMLARCRMRAQAHGYAPLLLHQRLHQLDPPRRYRTIVACGVFGLGSTRAQDEQALRRFYEALDPGGALLLDNEAPYANAHIWSRWTGAGRAELPEQYPAEGVRRDAADDSSLELRSRLLAVDPLDQCATIEICARRYRGQAEVATETHQLSMRMYLRDELLLMLERAGFSDVHVSGGYDGLPPTPDHEFLVFAARR